MKKVMVCFGIRENQMNESMKNELETVCTAGFIEILAMIMGLRQPNPQTWDQRTVGR